MLDFLELEETVGRAWHRLVGGTASYPVHAEHAVSLADVRNRIAIWTPLSPPNARNMIAIRLRTSASDTACSAWTG